ncbi:hypothetical protein [Streptomyces kasugaensis]|uniref:hypothetical protein n=1 Tax=Streptomyces kasugaensis TaxID=1946 RepID=UPI0013EF69DE|nr:hypothetical protein [Streptomyces kasugaensis]
MPSIHGLELASGDELGLDTTPICCDEEMAAAGSEFGCDDCGTTLTVGSDGLIFDIS